MTTTTAAPPQHHPSSTAAEAAAEAVVNQRRRRQCTCQMFKNEDKRENKTYQFNIKTTFRKIRSRNGRPLFLMQLQYLWSLKTAKKNRQSRLTAKKKPLKVGLNIVFFVVEEMTRVFLTNARAKCPAGSIVRLNDYVVHGPGQHWLYTSNRPSSGSFRSLLCRCGICCAGRAWHSNR